MSNVQKEARRDAHEYARAKMFYGEGAGVRRKLIENTVASKSERKVGYHEAFERALAREDMAEHAERARKERRRRDVSHSVSKNAKGLATGNYRSVNTSLLVVAAIGYVAHKTGYDKKLYDLAKNRYSSFQAQRRYKKARSHVNVYNVTSLKD